MVIFKILNMFCTKRQIAVQNNRLNLLKLLESGQQGLLLHLSLRFLKNFFPIFITSKYYQCTLICLNKKMPTE